jgi:hypothetical protein
MTSTFLAMKKNASLQPEAISGHRVWSTGLTHLGNIRADSHARMLSA